MAYLAVVLVLVGTFIMQPMAGFIVLAVAVGGLIGAISGSALEGQFKGILKP